ncbi:MAG: ATP-binding protein, partial [Deltaproteobacteria bacterium]|nr:ATP-binding protein [Deltaproteobacteria bacterium]
ECKTGEKHASAACYYFRQRTNIKQFYQVHLGTSDFGDAMSSVRVLPFLKFCKILELP